MFAVALLAITASLTPLTPVEEARAQILVESMKRSPRGPYSGVAWFCKDGTVQLPRAGACAERGGGRQHGVLSNDAKALAAMHIYVGSVLAELSPADLEADDLYRARALVVERFLERTLDGWVLSKAKAYRGARQIEDEEAAAIPLLQSLLGAPEPVAKHRNLLLRLVRALPYGARDGRTDEIRGLASQVGDLDRRFDPIRSKIHSLPEPTDVNLVAKYLTTASGEAKAKATELLAKLQAAKDPARHDDALRSVRQRISDRAVRSGIDRLLAAADAGAVVRAATGLLEAMEATLHKGPSDRIASRNLILLYGMGLVEERVVAVVAELTKAPVSRAEAITLLDELTKAAQILGLVSARERTAALEAIADLRRAKPESFAQGVDRIARTLDWARARHLSDFGLPMRRYQAVQAETYGLLDDLLRSGALLPAAALIDRLAADVDRLRGGGHQLVSVDRTAVRGENPGFAIGPLRVLPPGADPSGLKRNEIVLLFELGPELPPVAGLLTVGQAGSLSHVSLLAQNLGIPHVALTGEAGKRVERWAGRQVVLGVSAGRRVLLGPADELPPEVQAQLGTQPAAVRAMLEVDASRLDLSTTTIRSITEVSEKEAGIRLGPKAAELARLRRLFPDRVSDAAVIPFGAFVRHVSRRNGGPSPLEQLREVYIQSARWDETEKEARVIEALAKFRGAIETLPFVDGFEGEVDAALGKMGKPGTFGVFVRSDTNVEDLKDFTGAGLNLTVPNRVGLASVLTSIRAVWASPFSERSYRWRQQLLKNPEHVYPSVLLHRTVPSEVSGVVVTTDLETGHPGALTISVSEGVAAVVDGGAAETLVVEPSGATRLLSSSRIFSKRRIPAPPREGVVVEAADRTDPLLSDAALLEITGLVQQIKDKAGQPEAGVAWDIELGLLEGRAWLFQLRPLKASKLAAAHPLLMELDAQAKLPTEGLQLNEVLP